AAELCSEEKDKFDVIFFFGTLYHCKYPQFAIDKLTSLLADDGRMYIETAICDDEPNCPRCGRKIRGWDAETRHERNMIRWRYATAHWQREAK
ncbi:hypothetical protein LCGC14_2482450, partial [marine sediment metagenome]